MEQQPRPTSTPEKLPAGFGLYNRSLRPQASGADEVIIKRPSRQITVEIPLTKPGEKPKKYRYKGAVWTEHRVTVTHTEAEEDKDLEGKDFFVYLR